MALNKHIAHSFPNWVLSHFLSNSSLFIFCNFEHFIIVLIYLDDILVTSSNPNLILDLISALSIAFCVKDLGLLHYFLGIEVSQTKKGIFMSQSKYIINLLFKINMHNVKLVSTLMSTSAKLMASDRVTFKDPQL